MGNKSVSEKTAVSSGREREKENETENAENERAEIDDRVDAIRNATMAAFKSLHLVVRERTSTV